MKSTDLYRRILGCICVMTELSEQAVLHSNVEECSDARSVLVKTMSHFFSDNQIAVLIGRTRPGVSFIRRNFDIRMRKWSVERNWKEIRKLLESNYFTG